tara:strand:- start:8404 stop:9135 length:732 start_codon:yes stop_codon:yes gene_type:complete
MPKTEIDYSNTIFYKISCKDETNNELYIGHTTNFVQRKSAHKASCNNPKSGSYPVKLYKTIRECGGWDNWTMEIIAFRNCNDSREARKVEQEYYDSLGATLNSIQPLPPPKPISTNTEDKSKSLINQPDPSHFVCKYCHYITNNKKDYKKHLITVKHKRLTGTIRTPIENPFVCDCGKKYNHASSLCKHKRSCNAETTDNIQATSSNKLDKDDIILELLEQNKQFAQIIIEQNKQIMEWMKQN